MQVKEVFDIVPDKDKKGRTIYRLRFRHDGTYLPNGMGLWTQTCENIAYKWMWKNQKKAQDIALIASFEREVLEAPTGIEPVLTD